MKKFFTTLLFLLSSFFIFAESYKIVDSEFNIKGAGGLNIGKTSKTVLLMKCPIDKNTVFNSKEELEDYIDNYKQELSNTRAFEKIELRYDADFDQEADLYNIKIYFDLEDSSHFIALPYPKYDSNSGSTLKLKIKDSNFLGTLNPLSTDININTDSKFEKWKTGIYFSYNYPFKAGPFNTTWENGFSLDYVIGEKKPTASTDIGLSFSLPKDFYSVNFGATQVVNYNDGFSFREKLYLSTPFTLYKAKNYSTVSYSPSVNFSFYWKPKRKPELGDMSMGFGHSISNGKVDWNNCFRKGYSLSLSNSFSYNFASKFLIPSVSFEARLFNNFKIMDKSFLDRFGINTRLYAFSVIEVPNRGSSGNENLGGKMRGILDSRFDSSPCGIALNLDLPINIVTTHFPINLFNFTMQFSPFVDVALTSKPSEKVFNLKKIDLSAGFEVLVYPKRFSSYTIRGSIGFDLKSAMKEENKLKGLWHNKEIYIGLDLHY